METAGLEVVLGADYAQLEQGFSAANDILNQFSNNVIKTTAGLKDIFSGVNSNISININSDAYVAAMNAIGTSSDGAGKSIAGIISQVGEIPDAFKPSIDSVLQLANAISSLSNTSGGAIGGNSFSDVADGATKAAVATAQVTSAFDAASASAQTFVTGSVSLSNSLADNVAILNNYKIQVGLLQKQINDLNAANKSMTNVNATTRAQYDDNKDAIAALGAQQAVLKQQISQASTVINAQAKEMIAADDSYRSLQNNLTLATDAYKRLSAADRDSDIGQSLKANAVQLNNQLKAIDAEMGNFQRNVGNYASGTAQLNSTLQRSFHGLAEAFISPSRAILILANDIPQLINQFIALSAEVKAAKLAGDESASIFSGLNVGMLGLNLAVGVALTALIKFGPKLYDWATGAEEAKAKADALKKSQDELNSAFNSGIDSISDNISKVLLLTAAIENGDSPMSARIDKYNQLLALYPQLLGQINNEIGAHDKLNSGYPSLFKNLDDHKDKVNALDVAVQGLVKDLYNQAIAQGFADQVKKLADAGAELVGQTDKLKQAKDDADKALSNTPKPAQIIGAPIYAQSQVGADQFEAANTAAYNATKAYNDNIKAIADNQQQIKDAIANQQKYATAFQNSTNGITNYRQQLEDAVKTAQGERDTTAAGTQAHKDALNALTKAQQALDDFDGKQQKADASTKKLTKSQNDLSAALKDIDFKSAVDNNYSDLQAAQDKLNAYNKDLINQLKNGGSAANIAFDVDKINEYSLKVSELAQNAKEAKEQLSEWNNVSDIFSNLKSQTDGLKQSLNAGLITPLQYAQQDASNATSAIKKLLNLGVGANGSWIQNLQARVSIDNATEVEQNLQKQFKDIIDKTQANLSETNFELGVGLINPKQAVDQQISAYQSEIKELYKQIASVQNNPNVKITPQIQMDLSKAKTQIANDRKQLADLINKELGATLGDSVDKALQEIAKNGIGAFGDAFGEAIAGGDISKAVNSFMQNVGSTMEELGEKMIVLAITYSTAYKAFIAAISNPVTAPFAIAAAAGLVVLGGIIKAEFSKAASNSSKAFADGGIVYGPTNALIGEYAGARNNPEVVAPLNKLQSIIGTDRSPQYLIPDVKLNGSDIWLSFQRTQRSKSR